MSVSLPNGATISVGATYGPSKVASVVTNGTEAVSTLEAAHGVIVGDVYRIVSGWSKLNNRVARAKLVSTNDVTDEGIDTSDTTKFPAGTGIGSIQEVLTWQQVIQVLDANSAGGVQQFATYSFLEDSTERQIPTNKSAQSFTIQIADDQSLAQYAVLKAADEDRLPRVIRIILPSLAKIYFQAYVTMADFPSFTKNQVMDVQVTFSLVAGATRYAT